MMARPLTADGPRDGHALPVVSVIMPVYNTGAYLREAIDSVLAQVAVGDCAPPPLELVIVDDHSNDPLTLAVLAEARALPGVQVHLNQRAKGAAGARNTGIEHARGAWIGFLDSDDIWMPTALALRWRALARHPEINWCGARFRLLKPAPGGGPLRFDSAALLQPSAGAGEPAATILQRPLAAFADSCFVGIMTVLIRRELIVANAMFNEQLRRAEDYHLWFKCALGQDMLLLDAEIALYRIHPASLTHGDAPLLLHEDIMIKLLLADPAWAAHKALLTRRYDLILQDYCYFYRGKRRFGAALRAALTWVAHRPWHPGAWKEVLASSLRRA